MGVGACRINTKEALRDELIHSIELRSSSSCYACSSRVSP